MASPSEGLVGVAHRVVRLLWAHVWDPAAPCPHPGPCLSMVPVNHQINSLEAAQGFATLLFKTTEHSTTKANNLI